MTRRNGPDPLELERAVAWLELELAGGPVATHELVLKASVAGISPRTLERARARLGCQARKAGRVWFVHPADHMEAS